jgi:hypothetical protein
MPSLDIITLAGPLERLTLQVYQRCGVPRGCCVWAQVEELFQAKQLKKAAPKKAAAKRLAVLELKRATAIGIRMAGLKCASLEDSSAGQIIYSRGSKEAFYYFVYSPLNPPPHWMRTPLAMQHCWLSFPYTY